MGLSHAVSSIEMNPIYVVATEQEAWSVGQDRWISGVPLDRLVRQLGPGQHVYLVHLESISAGKGVKLTDLTGLT